MYGSGIADFKRTLGGNLNISAGFALAIESEAILSFYKTYKKN
jgi:hypothetical protein